MHETVSAITLAAVWIVITPIVALVKASSTKREADAALGGLQRLSQRMDRPENQLLGQAWKLFF